MLRSSLLLSMLDAVGRGPQARPCPHGSRSDLGLRLILVPGHTPRCELMAWV